MSKAIKGALALAGLAAAGVVITKMREHQSKQDENFDQSCAVKWPHTAKKALKLSEDDNFCGC